MVAVAPKSSSLAKKNGWRGCLVLGLWIALIFGTSCTVIRPNEFFELVSWWTGAEQESMRQFELFWGVSWFAIVKGWHFTEFLILTFLTASVIKWWQQEFTTRSVAVSILLCMVFAASDEWHQTFVPGRYGTVRDVLIDSLGVCMAGVILLLRLRRQNARQRTETAHPT